MGGMGVGLITLGVGETIKDFKLLKFIGQLN